MSTERNDLAGAYLTGSADGDVDLLMNVFKKVKCTCECHKPGVKMKHCVPCCNEGELDIHQHALVLEVEERRGHSYANLDAIAKVTIE
jgi:hypothetical protein